MKFEIYQGKDKKWYWRVRADNGKIVADGAQGYANKGSAKRAVKTFRGHMGLKYISVRYV